MLEFLKTTAGPGLPGPDNPQSDSKNNSNKSPFIKVKELSEGLVKNLYTYVWSAIKSFWKTILSPTVFVLKFIFLPPWTVLCILWELIKCPIVTLWNYLNRKSNDHTPDENEYVKWYKNNRLESFAILGIFSTGFSLALAFIFAQTLLLGDIDFTIENTDAYPQIVFSANLINIDSDARTFTIDWYPGPPDPSNCERNLDFVANIYLDQNLLDASNPSSEAGSIQVATPENPFSSTAPSTSVAFQYNVTQACAETATLQDSKNTFRTVSKLGDLSNNKKGRSTLQAYPLDKYIAQVSMFALDNSTGESIPMNISLTWGTVVNFKAVLDRSPAGSFASSDGIYLLFDISRSTAVKLFVYSVVLTNWIVTNAFLWLSIACVLWSNEKIIKEMFVLPVTALFAFTTVRANMPGAPSGFGAYVDFLGILPNLVLLTFSSAATLMTVLGRRIYNEVKMKELEEKEMENNGGFNGMIEKNDISMLVTVIASEIKKKIDMDAEGVQEIKEKRGESSDDEDEEEGGNDDGDGKRKKYKEYFILKPKRVTKYRTSSNSTIRNRNNNTGTVSSYGRRNYSTRPLSGTRRGTSDYSAFKSENDDLSAAGLTVLPHSGGEKF